MDFTNTFTVKVSLDRVWAYLLDAEKVTPCVPGAQLTETVDEHRYKGTVKIKLGAVQMVYRGELEMEADEPTHTILLRAKGTESRGSGGATGTVMTRLSSDDSGATTVVMESHVDVTGRVAQFGRGIMQDVANRLVKEFAQCLEAHVTAEQEAREAGPDSSDTGPGEQDVLPAQSSMTPGEATNQETPTSTAAAPAPTTASPASAPAQTPPAPNWQPTPMPVHPHRAATEIRAFDLLLGIARTRLAALLRFLADKLDPNA